MQDLIRLAIVGPPDSAAIAYEIALEKRDCLIPMVLAYADASEVPDILKRNGNDFDMWLFSGIIPYQRAKTADSKKPLFYVPHAGSSLYRALLEILYIKKLTCDSISFDTFSEREIVETFKDTALPLPKIYANQYKGIVTASEVTEWHYDLWKSGKTNIAVTCLLATYNKLAELGVPVVRIWPTRCNIRTTLELAIKSFETQRVKRSQLAVQRIVIDDYDDIVRSNSSYEAKRLELKLYEILLAYIEKLKGSISMNGGGKFTLYSTRGTLTEITENFTVMPIIEEMTRQVDVNISGGIGLGLTVYDAEENSFSALGLGKQQGKGVWMVVNDDHTVIGPLSSKVHLKYSVRTNDHALRNLADQLNISVTTINKLLATIDKLDRDDIVADDLAMYLKITVRSARRMLSNLVEKGFARVVGEELVGKGRPRRLYKINIKELLQPVQE